MLKYLMLHVESWSWSWYNKTLITSLAYASAELIPALKQRRHDFYVLLLHGRPSNR